MAIVDFTLDDIEVRVRKVVKLELVEAEARIKQQSIAYIRTVNGELKDELLSAMDDVKTELRTEMHDMKTELRGEMHDMATELRTEMREMTSELRGETGEMRSEMMGEFQKQSDKIDGLQREMQGVKQVVNQHSVDIVELRAKTA